MRARDKKRCCSCCGQWKRLTQFYRSKGKYRYRKCCPCEDNHRKGRTPCLHVPTRRCCRCEVVKPATEFAGKGMGNRTPCFGCQENPPETVETGRRPMCDVCREPLVMGTDLNGRLLETCDCGTRFTEVRRLTTEAA